MSGGLNRTQSLFLDDDNDRDSKIQELEDKLRRQQEDMKEMEEKRSDGGPARVEHLEEVIRRLQEKLKVCESPELAIE